MTPDDELGIDELAQAILDGDDVDWTSIESPPAGASRFARHLRIVAAVAKAHRDQAAAAPSSGASSGAGIDHPESWGHLRITALLGRGACGSVYRAWDPRLEREVALKLVPLETTDTTAGSIIREGRLLARVGHPNVVTIHGADQIGEHVGLWMELVRGHTLHQMLEDGGTLQPPEVARIGIELARAVTAVHAAGLLHRDIKAQNAMRRDDGRIVLMDFGTGRELEDPSPDISGTPLYLAPEILRGQSATARTDIYSLGVLLFHLLTRSFPVQGRTIHDIRHAHDQGTRAGLRALRPDVPSRLARVVEQAIAPRPEERHATAETFSTALLAAAAPAHRWWWYGAAVAAVVAVVTVATWVKPEPPLIGILPFEYHTGEPDRAQTLASLSDGFIFELNRRLAQVEGLRVRSAVSSIAYRGQPRDLKAFGRQLGVNHVLEGSVFEERGTIRRINASLVRVADEETVWAESFAPEDNDLFAVQEQIALAIVNRLRLKFELGRRQHQTEPDLHRLFLRARAYRARRDAESTNRATVLFEEIISLDPSFVPATAGLAHALLTNAPDRDFEPPLDPRAEMLARKAYDDDPLWPEADTAMGLLCAHKHEWQCARTYFETAMRLDPSFTATHTHFVLTTLMPLGEDVEALRVVESARVDDPQSLDVKRVLAHVQVENELYELAMATSRDVMAQDPSLRFVEQWLGRALYLSGRPQEALEVFRRPGQWGYRGYILALLGRRAEAEALLAANPNIDARHMLVHAGLGNRDPAFDALERAAASAPWRTVMWMQRKEMALLHGDPRYESIRKRLLAPRQLTPAGNIGLTNPSSSQGARSAAESR